MENSHNNILKPQNDLKEYKYIELPNKIQGILVSTKKYMEHFKITTEKKHQASNQDENQGINPEEDRSEDYEDIDDDEEENSMDVEGEGDDEGDGEEGDDEGEEEEDEEDDKKKKKKIGLASCSLVVGAGSFFDPKDIQGLAHLLEHVIFLGSKEFPGADEYSKFMSRHGGYENAYTSFDATTYEFDVDNEFLGEALYRLSRLIKEPILGSEGIQKEVQAVNNEFDLAAADEDVQRFQVIQGSFKENFPLNSFTWGNSKSLSKPEKELQQGVREFYENYYHPEKIRVCIQANHSLEEMEKIFRKAFEDFESKGEFKSPLKVDENDIKEAKANFHSFSFLKSSNQVIKLTFTWAVTTLDKEIESFPLDLILEILNERGEGSLYCLLKEKQLITDFSAEMNTIDGQDNCYVYLPWLMLKLTDHGLKNLKTIIDYVGQYINMLKNVPVPEYYLKEWMMTNQLEFKYADEMAEDQLANTLAHSLKKIPFERLLEAGVYRVPRFFNESLYNSVLEDLSLMKARVDIQFPDINEELTNLKINKDQLYEHEEKNFSVKWTSLDFIGLIGQELADFLNRGKFDDKLYSYPKKNDLIAENVEIKDILDNFKIAKKIEDSSDSYELWHSFDSNYKIPKACVNLIIFFRFMKSPIVNNYMELLESYIKEEYSKTIGNNAIKAGYDVSLNKCEFCSFELNIYGFSDKLVSLTEKILQFMQQCYQNINEEMFEFVREKKVKQYETIMDDPETYIKRASYKVFFDFSLMPEERKDFFSNCKFEDFKAFCLELSTPKSVSNVKIQTHGNISIDESKQIKTSIIKYIKPEFHEERLPKYLLSPTGKPLGGFRKIISHEDLPVVKLKCHLKENKNNLVVFFAELDVDSVKSKLYLQVLNQIFNTEIFDDLRVKQDIGYISNSYTNIFTGLAIGLEIWVSSSKLGSSEITKKIAEFIDRFLNQFLEKMTETEFDSSVQSELSIKQKPFHTIQELGDYYWGEIKYSLNVMNRKEEEIKLLKELTFKDFKDWVRSRFNEKKFFAIEIDINESVEDPNPYVNVDKVKKLIQKYPDIHEYYLE
jgi:nardilysin